MTAIESEPTAPTWPEPTTGLNQPRRALVAAAELVAAGLLLWLAVWLWSRGTLPQSAIADRPELVFERYLGNWIAGAVAAGTAALLLLLDAARQLVLAVRTRSREA